MPTTNCLREIQVSFEPRRITISFSSIDDAAIYSRLSPGWQQDRHQVSKNLPANITHALATDQGFILVFNDNAAAEDWQRNAKCWKPRVEREKEREMSLFWSRQALNQALDLNARDHKGLEYAATSGYNGGLIYGIVRIYEFLAKYGCIST